MKKVRRSLVLPLILLACLIGFAGVHNPSAGGGGGSTTLSELTDTAITSPTVGNLLRYDGTNWLNTSGWVDRGGDDGGWDWDRDDLTINNVWTTIDIGTNRNGTAVVPVGAKIALIRVSMQDDSPEPHALFLQPANSSNIYGATPFYGTRNSVRALGMLVGLNGTNTLIKYKVSTALTNASTLSLVVLGWGY